MVTFLCMQMSLITQWIVCGYISVYANVIDNTVDSSWLHFCVYKCH